MADEGWVELGPGVFRRRYAALDQGICAILADGALLLVDTRATFTEADELLADLRHLAPLPVTHVVNTHAHFDHVFGNARFVPAETWAHERCARRLREDGERLRGEAIAWARTGGPGMAALVEGLAGVRIVPPDHTVGDDGAVLEIGGRLVELHHLGRGHTDGDLVVAVPDAGVIASGDLVEEGAPPSFEDSFPLEWPDTLDAIAALARSMAEGAGAPAIAPGHGAVVDVAFVERQALALRAVAATARACHAEGLTAGDAARRVDLPPGVAAVAVARAYAQLDGHI